MKIDPICEKYYITALTLYRWRNKFLEDKVLWNSSPWPPGWTGLRILPQPSLPATRSDDPSYGNNLFTERNILKSIGTGQVAFSASYKAS